MPRIFISYRKGDNAVSAEKIDRLLHDLYKRVNVLVAPLNKSEIGNWKSKIDLRWLLKRLGSKNVTSLLV